jgi:hypothetical protein
VENEYGFRGSNQEYLRALIRIARASLGKDVIIYTTDPPALAARGSLPGGEVYTCVWPFSIVARPQPRHSAGDPCCGCLVSCCIDTVPNPIFELGNGWLLQPALGHCMKTMVAIV